MAFEGLRDSLKERWADLSAKIQETSAYNTVREKFESQPAATQRAIILGGIGIATLFVLSFPFGYLSTSGDNMTQFEENRALIRGLLRAARVAKEASPLPPPMDGQNLRQTIERVLHEKRLVPEQIGDMQAIPGAPAKDLAPPAVVQNGIAAQIKQLNVTQIVDIANTFQNLGAGTKLIGMDIVQTTGQTHYYDIIARVVNFGLPMLAPESERPAANRKGAPKRPSNPDAEGEE